MFQLQVAIGAYMYVCGPFSKVGSYDKPATCGGFCIIFRELSVFVILYT